MESSEFSPSVSPRSRKPLLEHSVLHPIVRLNDHHPHRADPEEVPHLQCMRRRLVLAIPQKPASARVAGKRLGCRHDPEGLA
eukprot:1646477-Ditylum_brightwellii.AAC.1